MIALAGFAVGYVLGARAGQKGLEEVIRAGQEVMRSDEFKALVQTATAIAGNVLKGVIQQGVSGEGEGLARGIALARRLTAA